MSKSKSKKKIKKKFNELGIMRDSKTKNLINNSKVPENSTYLATSLYTIVIFSKIPPAPTQKKLKVRRYHKTIFSKTYLTQKDFAKNVRNIQQSVLQQPQRQWSGKTVSYCRLKSP